MNDPDLLGKIHISLPRVKIQARMFGTGNDGEIARLFVHGFFHLLGYDHVKEADRAAMEKKEAKYWSAL